MLDRIGYSYQSKWSPDFLNINAPNPFGNFQVTIRLFSYDTCQFVLVLLSKRPENLINLLELRVRSVLLCNFLGLSVCSVYGYCCSCLSKVQKVYQFIGIACSFGVTICWDCVFVRWTVCSSTFDIKLNAKFGKLLNEINLLSNGINWHIKKSQRTLQAHFIFFKRTKPTQKKITRACNLPPKKKIELKNFSHPQKKKLKTQTHSANMDRHCF